MARRRKRRVKKRKRQQGRGLKRFIPRQRGGFYNMILNALPGPESLKRKYRMY